MQRPVYYPISFNKPSVVTS
uniref:Uncharacterized protein n=1 Tax=Arundo donax TaxID=35708 RepID=A0A0A9A897_ARUDO